MQTVYSNTPWEKQVSYCRAKKVGNLVFVSGTVAANEKGEVMGDDVYLQSKYIFEKIKKALNQCGFGLEDVVRTRTFITDISKFDLFAKAHHEFFQGIDPAATCVEVSGFVSNTKSHL
jgi:enamine deaminase RidA (YjgF/YER057c/UK114 family)